MQKYTPYIFPLIVVIIVFFLVYRWYTIRTQRDSQTSDIGEGIQIENLTPEQLQDVMRGSQDVSTAKLEPTDTSTPETAGRGSIRYEIKNGKVNFTVAADLPQNETVYHVWVRSQNADDLTDAFVLESGKGGYMGSAAISEDRLPLEVIVSPATQKSEVMNSVVLKGVIEAPTASPSPSPTASPAAE
jgi:hypothetical protein